MSNTYKTLTANDRTTVTSKINESVTQDGALWDHTDTYGYYPDNTNVEDMPTGKFQRVHDYTYTNSSSNHLFDITLGIHPDSCVYETGAATTNPYHGWNALYQVYDSTKDSYKDKKNNNYTSLAHILVGHDKDGNIRKFDKDGDFFGTTTDKWEEVFALNFSRLLVKDGIKKGSFEMIMAMNPYGYTQTYGSTPSDPSDDYDWSGGSNYSSYIKITDYDYVNSSEYKVNSPVGEYGILYAQNCDSSGAVLSGSDYVIESTILDSDDKVACGLIFYQAGVIVLTTQMFSAYNSSYTDFTGFLNSSAAIGAAEDFYMLYDSSGTYGMSPVDPTDTNSGSNPEYGFYDILEIMRGYEEAVGATNDEDISINDFADALRQRIVSIQFSNNIELNSTVYFCRLNHNDFNYSSNPTYTTNSKINVKETSNDEPITYITGIGLYDANNNLLAVGKLSEPLKKTPSSEHIVRLRIDS